MPVKPRSLLDPSSSPGGCASLDRHILAYRQYLADRGNAAGYARSCEAAVVHLSMWMKCARKNLKDIDEGLVAAFVDEHLPGCHCATSARHPSSVRAALNHLLIVLRAASAIAPSPVDMTEVGEELRRYDQYMEQVRGLAPNTRDGALRIVEALLRLHFGDGTIRFEDIRPERVRRFFAAQAKSYKAPTSLGAVVAALRGYFRWRATLGDRTHALVGALSYPASWQLSSLPKSLEPAEVEQLEAALGQSGPSMLRADAMVRCMLDLGLRSGEVARLSMDDIDWDAGTITLRRTKGPARRRDPAARSHRAGHCRVPAQRTTEDPAPDGLRPAHDATGAADRAGPGAQDHPPGVCARRAAVHALASAAPHDGRPPSGRRSLAQGGGRRSAAPIAEHDADLRQAGQRQPRRSGPAVAGHPCRCHDR
jgi:integrase